MVVSLKESVGGAENNQEGAEKPHSKDPFGVMSVFKNLFAKNLGQKLKRIVFDKSSIVIIASERGIEIIMIIKVNWNRANLPRSNDFWFYYENSSNGSRYRFMGWPV